jgi:hypothetical protein
VPDGPRQPVVAAWQDEVMPMSTMDHDHDIEPGALPAPDTDRDIARKRLQARRDFTSHLVSYIVVNAFLIGVWAVTGAGYFWPFWVMAGWGVGLLLHAWETFAHGPITEADVDAEVRRLHH